MCMVIPLFAGPIIIYELVTKHYVKPLTHFRMFFQHRNRVSGHALHSPQKIVGITTRAKIFSGSFFFSGSPEVDLMVEHTAFDTDQ